MIWLIALALILRSGSSLPTSSPPEEEPTKSNFGILKDERTHGNDGTYSFNYETENGISRSESRTISESGAIVTRGRISYEMPNGEMFVLTFIADENGYRPTSSFLPVAPAFPHPIPDFVQNQIDKARKEDEEMALNSERETQTEGMENEAKATENVENGDMKVEVNTLATESIIEEKPEKENEVLIEEDLDVLKNEIKSKPEENDEAAKQKLDEAELTNTKNESETNTKVETKTDENIEEQISGNLELNKISE